jgi:ribosomal protein S18 acetylase RimI-like enzyme
MNVSLRTAITADAPAVSALVQAVFREFVAPDWEPQAREVFATESSPQRFAQLLAEPAFASVAEAGERLVGFILLPTPNLLAFLFIDSSSHRQGIATALWCAARAHLEANYPAVKTVELNSSPYAVAAYKALGFYPISEPFRRGGCLATRMACWLPGQALAAAHNAA